MGISVSHGETDSGGGAGAALGLCARRLLALQLALRLCAVGRLDTLVVASKFFADRSALGFGGFAGGVAAGRLANRLALGAAILLTEVLGATNGAGGLLAVDSARGAGRLLALHLALGALAHGVALGWAGRVIALPSASGVTLTTNIF